MSVNLINGNDTNISQSGSDIMVNFSPTRNQQISDIESNIQDLQADMVVDIALNTEVKLNYTYGGSDVYFKRITIDSFPNATTKTVATSITNATLIKSYIYMDDGASLILLPYVSPTSQLANMVSGSVKKDCTVINLTAGTNRSGLSGFADIYYTKS